MTFQSFLILFSLTNLVVWILGIYHTSFKHHPHQVVLPLFPLGIFVWGDAVVYALFWVIAGLVCLVRQDSTLFGLIVSIFWTIRGLGETMYWLHEQYTAKNRNLPETLYGLKIFPGESIWFAYQIIAQVITITAIIFSIYFAQLWLATTPTLHL